VVTGALWIAGYHTIQTDLCQRGSGGVVADGDASALRSPLCRNATCFRYQGPDNFASTHPLPAINKVLSTVAGHLLRHGVVVDQDVPAGERFRRGPAPG
jgi:hypothetical protein